QIRSVYGGHLTKCGFAVKVNRLSGLVGMKPCGTQKMEAFGIQDPQSLRPGLCRAPPVLLVDHKASANHDSGLQFPNKLVKRWVIQKNLMVRHTKCHQVVRKFRLSGCTRKMNFIGALK